VGLEGSWRIDQRNILIASRNDFVGIETSGKKNVTLHDILPPKPCFTYKEILPDMVEEDNGTMRNDSEKLVCARQSRLSTVKLKEERSQSKSKRASCTRNKKQRQRKRHDPFQDSIRSEVHPFCVNTKYMESREGRSVQCSFLILILWTAEVSGKRKFTVTGVNNTYYKISGRRIYQFLSTQKSFRLLQLLLAPASFDANQVNNVLTGNVIAETADRHQRLSLIFGRKQGPYGEFGCQMLCLLHFVRPSAIAGVQLRGALTAPVKQVAVRTHPVP
jgi:hypothetical protein